MTLQDYIERIKLELTGGVLELELSDEQIGKVVNSAMIELRRYIDTTNLITIPYATCIDMKDVAQVSSIVKVYRAVGLDGDVATTGSSIADPMYAQRWMIFSSGGTMYNLQNYLLNYMSWNTLLQLRNTTSTDLAFRWDDERRQLYINANYDRPTSITIEYVPTYSDVSEVRSVYWQQVLTRLSVAMTKQILGRIRTRYTQNNALWTQDGDKILEEGNNERNAIEEKLDLNSTLFYPCD